MTTGAVTNESPRARKGGEKDRQTDRQIEKRTAYKPRTRTAKACGRLARTDRDTVTHTQLDPSPNAARTRAKGRGLVVAIRVKFYIHHSSTETLVDYHTKKTLIGQPAQTQTATHTLATPGVVVRSRPELAARSGHAL